MKVLVCNAGSSTLKFSLFEAESERSLADGVIDWTTKPCAGDLAALARARSAPNCRFKNMRMPRAISLMPCRPALRRPYRVWTTCKRSVTEWSMAVIATRRRC